MLPKIENQSLADSIVVLVRKDEDKRTSKGGIVLPDDARIPVFTGRALAFASYR
jgi:co-chaperonin GroES (HSP10)